MPRPAPIRPGRLSGAAALTPAERMRRYRLRRRRAGHRESIAWVSTTPVVYSDHQRLEARSLAMHCLIAQKLLADPALLAKARQNLAHWKRTAPRPLPAYFAEWDRILKRGAEHVAGFMAQQDVAAVRLRQSSPFAGLLTRAERERIYAAFQ